MIKRSDRHDVIREIIRRGDMRTQRDLVEELKAAGYECTQATVSRDTQDMGLVKTSDGFYALPEDLHLQRMMGGMVESIDIIQFVIVIRTASGVANAVCAAFDDAKIPGVAGSVAGDDTIIVICYDAQSAQNVAKMVSDLHN